MKRYYTFTIKKLVTVQHLVTMEYLQMDSHFTCPHESHDFYEFIYVEKGLVTCKLGQRDYLLQKNAFFLVPKNIEHSYHVAKDDMATVLIVCFKSNSNIISVLRNPTFMGGECKELLEKILFVARETFVFPFNKKLVLNSHPRLGSQQLIENYIEEVLIKLIQRSTTQKEGVQIVTDAQSIKQALVEEVMRILRHNIYGDVDLQDICRQTFYSKTYLNNIFKEIHGVTIMQYYQTIKIEEAKKLLEAGGIIGEISEKLGYDSPQYFSKVFKQRTGMTPTQYKER